MNRLAIIYFLSLLILEADFVQGQNNKSFMKSIAAEKKNAIDSLLNFNTEKNKLAYLAVLPSINYNFFENSFNVGVSVSNLANFYQTKHRNKIELERLRFQLNEKKENDLVALENEYDLILDTYEILKLELDNTTLAKEIFDLKKAQYENNKITLEEWLNVQKNNQDRNLLLFAKRKNLMSKMKQFEAKIKRNCFSTELKYLANDVI
jgi:sigma54-dependent transcription regulator